MVDAVGRPGPVVGWYEEVGLDLGEETAGVVLYQPVLSQKVSPEYRLFHFGTHKLMSKKPSAQVYFSRGGAKGWDVVAAGAGQSEVDRPGPALWLTLRPQGDG